MMMNKKFMILSSFMTFMLVAELAYASVPQDKIKDKSKSEMIHEWLFVSYAEYENRLPVIEMGPQSTAIFNQSIKNEKSYVEYLNDLLSAVTPAIIDGSSEIATAPEDIMFNGSFLPIQGKSIQVIYDNIKTSDQAIGIVRPRLQPESVKQTFLALCKEGVYCVNQQGKIQKTINLFTQSEKNYPKLESFGDRWLLRPKEYKGTSPAIVCAPDISYAKTTQSITEIDEDKNVVARALFDGKSYPLDSVIDEKTYNELVIKITTLKSNILKNSTRDEAVELIKKMFLVNTDAWRKNIIKLKKIGG